MAILLAQLGDIHVKGDSDKVLLRAERIGAAISAEVTPDTTCAVLAVCGDASFSGKSGEFAACQQLIHQIESYLKQQHDTLLIKRLTVPGNHDCDFTGDQAARDLILPTICGTEKPAESVRSIVMKPLEQYFAFAETIAGSDSHLSLTRPFYCHIDVVDGGRFLRIHQINTAWMSSLREQPGSLTFPLGELSPGPGSPVLSFAIIHHPTQWFSQPHAMRPLRDKLSELANIVLVNHEHVSEAFEQRRLFDADASHPSTIYVSGGVLQESPNSSKCSFNVIRVDLQALAAQITRYKFNESDVGPHFVREASEQVSIGAAYPQSAFKLVKEFEDTLDDPGAPVTHPLRDPRNPLRLQDFFLYPDLWELDEDHDGSQQRQVRSNKVVETILGNGKSLITGGEKSGRTSLVKSLFRECLMAAKVPLLLNGADLPKRPEQLRNRIRKAVSEQYKTLTPDAFEQLPSDNRVVLVDDIHRLPVGGEARKSLLRGLEQQFGQVILCGDDLLKIEELKGKDARESGLWEYRHLVILGFGEYLRAEFVRKWIVLGRDIVPEEEFVEAEIERLCHMINAVIRQQLIPSYPLFLILVLQQANMAKPNVQGGSFGHLFEGVITAILSRSAFGKISIGDKYNYLGALAMQMYLAKAMSMSRQEFEKWHTAYWDNIELRVGVDEVLDDFQILGILSQRADTISFRYAYFFCFFVAYFLNQRVHESKCRQQISELCQRVYHRVSADIVLFLAHLTGDPIVLDEMIKACERLIDGAPLVMFDEDVDPVNKLNQHISEMSLPDSRPDENRTKLRLQSDDDVRGRLAAALGQSAVEAPEADSDQVKRVFEVHAAYKSVQILGQALRNIAGSADRATKETVINKVVSLSRRLLGSYFESFDAKHLPDLIQEIGDIHREHHPDISTSELNAEINKHLFGLSLFVCFAVIKHTSLCIGSENLAPTQQRLLSESESLAERVFGLSIGLDRPGRFPKDEALKLYRELAKNPFAQSVVRMLIAHHLYMYTVPYNERQSVCSQTAIKLLPSVLDPSRKKLLS